MGLKPWEYYRLTMREFDEMMHGFQLKEQMEWDKIRWHATIVAKMGGAKKIKKPTDLMKLPLIDGDRQKATEADMVAYLKQMRAGGG